MLTAKELHDLYNGPFTMKDGSTRRALWERVPETRPDHGTRSMFDLQQPETGSTLAWWDMHQLPHEAACALCRVAVEDWISKESTLDMSFCRREGGFMVRASRRNVFDAPVCACEHRAFVEAAHALADVSAIAD